MFEYCESSSWIVPQPLNLISNVAFILVALAFKQESVPKGTSSLCLLVATTSSIWHLTEASWALKIDAVAVTTLCFYLAGYEILSRTGGRRVLPGIFLILTLCVLSSQFIPIDNLKTSFFFPLIAFLVLLSTQSGLYLRAALSLFFACIFRAIDVPFCSSFPQGTHWLWHLFSALALFYAISALATRQGNELKPS